MNLPLFSHMDVEAQVVQHGFADADEMLRMQAALIGIFVLVLDGQPVILHMTAMDVRITSEEIAIHV